MGPDANVTGNFCPPSAQDTSWLAGGHPAMALTTSLGSRSFLSWLDLPMNLAEDMLSQSLLGRGSLHDSDPSVESSYSIGSLHFAHTKTYFLCNSRKRKGKKLNRWWFCTFSRILRSLPPPIAEDKATDLYLHSCRKHSFWRKSMEEPSTQPANHRGMSEPGPSSEILSSFSFPSALPGLTGKPPGRFPIYVLQCPGSLPSNHLLERGFMIQIW